MRPARFLSVMLLCAGLVSPHAAAAAPGDLDPGFGVGGIATTDLGVDASVLGVQLRADGRIVVGGVAWGDTTAVALARYTSAGALDPTFGAGGTTVGGAFDFVNSVVFPADGAVLAGVAVPFGGPCCQFAVARFTGDGASDPAFGSGGVAAISSARANVLGLAVQTDGKIVAVGNADGLMIARFHANGVLDASFGASGTVVRAGAAANAVVLQPDGKIVVAGHEMVDGTTHVMVARYDATGTPDATFGSGGSVTTVIDARSAAVGLALQNDGKVVVAGHARRADGRHVFVAVRYETSGTTDAGFGTAGVVRAELERNAFAYAVAVQPDGKIVLGGEAEHATTGLSLLALARLDGNGALDAGFGTGGVVTTSGGGDFDAVWQLRLQPDGKIIAGGWSTDGATFRMRLMVARFLGDPPVVEGPTYEFTGFFRPVRNAPALNVVQAGRAVPVKFSLNGDQGLSIFPTDASGQALYPASVAISCSTLEPLAGASPVTTTQRLDYDEAADQYIYVWKTARTWAGTCRQLTVTLNDGSEHLANFRFTK